ncbi:hypothetical protein ACWV26_03110 [Rummeliibacillus sp. JY-2-4R]
MTYKFKNANTIQKIAIKVSKLASKPLKNTNRQFENTNKQNALLARGSENLIPKD